MSADEVAIRALIERWIAATRDGDVDAVLSENAMASGS